jgi:hypothetical protein
MQHYYYQQALELLFIEHPTKEDLTDALADLSSEYGYVYYSAIHGYLQNAEPELRRLTVVIQLLKTKIKQFKQMSKMFNSDISTKVLKYCHQKQYPISTFNIIYLEGVNLAGTLNSDEPDQFNDVRAIFNQERCLGIWEATSEPGRWYTDYPMNFAGAFRIAFGFHEKAWQIGLHGNSEPHEALIQIDEIAGYRDYNRDMIRTGDQPVVGIFGINQHHGYDLLPNSIGEASAGCLVGRTRDGHREFMHFCKNSGLTLFDTIVLSGDEVFK